MAKYGDLNSYRDKRMRRFYIRMTLLLIFIFIPIMTGYYAYRYVTEIVNREDSGIEIGPNEGEAMEIYIPKGSNAEEIISILKENGVIKNDKVFKLLSKINGYDGKYKSGTHLVSSVYDYENLKGYDDLMRILSANPLDNPTIDVTIPEGYTVKQMVKVFADKGLITEEEFYTEGKESYDFKFLEGLPQREHFLEGYLFPETYTFDTKGGAKHVITKMLTQFNMVFRDDYYERATQLGMTVDQIIILASIIEREAQAPEDRDIISGVFYNRLKSRDPTLNYLQSCATIQYVFLMQQGIIKEQILQEDTYIDSPYNTYRHAGLPPGPICCPGEEAIKAALFPEDTDYLYFVARGDGTHQFSKTFDEHVNAMRKYGQLLQ